MAFLSELSPADRDRLRAIVRKIHLKHVPQHMLTNYECDKLIDAWGPEVAGNIVRKAMNAGLVG